MNREVNEPKYLISMISEMLNVHPQTLRTYEKLGLVRPKRSKGNTRLYSDADLERVRRILALTRDMGVNLAGVEVVFRLQDQINDMYYAFHELIEFINREFFCDNPEMKKQFRNYLIKSPLASVIKWAPDDIRDR